MKKRLVTISITGFLLIIAFALFSKYVKSGHLKEMDFAVSVKIQEKIDKSSRLRTAALVGNIMEGSTFFASPEFCILAVAILTLFKTVNLKKRRILLSGLLIPILFGLLVMAEIYGKSVVHHPAPPFYMIKNPTTIFPKFYINDQYSYPSGHAARSLFLCLVLIGIFGLNRTFFKKKSHVILSALMLSYILLVGISRIYLGHHWFSDVIGGWLLGLGLGIFTFI